MLVDDRLRDHPRRRPGVGPAAFAPTSPANPAVLAQPPAVYRRRRVDRAAAPPGDPRLGRALLLERRDHRPADAVYFSAVTYTTTGYGDVVLPAEWRLDGAVEALTGILMCG